MFSRRRISAFLLAIGMAGFVGLSGTASYGQEKDSARSKQALELSINDIAPAPQQSWKSLVISSVVKTPFTFTI